MWNKERFGCASIILAGDRLILLTEAGDLVTADADPRSYRERSRARVLQQTPIRAHPAIADGILFARDGGTLVTLDLREK
jgi:hypothetical protein